MNALAGFTRSGGFMPPYLGGSDGWDGIARSTSTSLIERWSGGARTPELGDILRSGMTNDQVEHALRTMYEIQRGITSGTSGFPVRESLEAPARILVPQDTPFRNMLPRLPGAGTAHQWRQVTSLGGGYGINTTVTSGAASATQTVGSTVGMQAGDTLWFGTTATSRVVSSVTNATTVVLTATITTTTSETVTRFINQPGGATPNRAFYAESGAPAEFTTSYVAKTAGYKLLGVLGSVTGFAMATGANFQNQYATETTNALKNTMLLEENALINGSSTIITAPWGDGTTALGFDGIRNLVTTGNGVPTDQIQTSVGALTLSHIDNQLMRIWNQGGTGCYLLMHPIDALSLAHLTEATGSTTRVVYDMPNNLIAGRHVKAYVSAVDGTICPVIASRFMQAGTIIFGSMYLPDGSPAAEVRVLPQVQLPMLAADQQIQGYTARELAPTTSAVDVHPFVVTVYETLVMKGATVFAKSTGVTAV